ncbi:NAD(P)-binding domain-containing protein [Acidimicrobiaceae bacterium]|nr:NAD(P)-binding domain-containing protein [Acidimicrobiaceae bacterium]
MKKIDIHIVGLGNLGSAFLKGLRDLHKKTDIYLYEESKDVRQFIEESYSLTPKESLDMISKGVLILCIKPQNINEFFDIYKDKISKDVLICTPIAGLEIKTIKKYLENNVLRIMPNLLIQDKNGFIPFTSNYEGDYLNFIHNILEDLGTVKEVDESMFAIVTALSGSGPAWFYELSNQLVNAGTKLGLSSKDSELIVQELLKALPSLVHEDETFENLVNKVKSPGGTTEAGLNSLNNASFDTIIFEAIQKATQRSTEISKELNNE